MSLMETNEKKTLKDLFQNKQFLYVLPIFMLIVGGLLYMTFAPSDSATPVGDKNNALNALVPVANNDTTGKSKLAIQQAQQGQQEEQALKEASAFQAQVPQGFEKVMYSGGGERLPQGPQRDRVDTSLYARSNQGAYGQSYRPRSGGGLPRSLRAAGGRASAVADNIPLREQDVTVGEPTGRASSRESVEEANRKKEEIQALVEKRKKLESLLEEYKADKTRKALADADQKIVRKAQDDEVVGSLVQAGKSANGFYGLYTEDAKKLQRAKLDEQTGTIRAMVYGDQVVMNQGRVKIRLLEPITIRGITMPANSLVYGVGSFGAERVQVKITSLMYEDHIFPVAMTVYDMDGLSGIYVPDVQGLNEAKMASSQAISGINISSGGYGGGINPAAAVGTSAASAAIQGARQLVQRKAQIQKAHLKSNYYVLLRSSESGNGIN